MLWIFHRCLPIQLPGRLSSSAKAGLLGFRDSKSPQLMEQRLSRCLDISGGYSEFVFAPESNLETGCDFRCLRFQISNLAGQVIHIVLCERHTNECNVQRWTLPVYLCTRILRRSVSRVVILPHAYRLGSHRKELAVTGSNSSHEEDDYCIDLVFPTMRQQSSC